MNRSERLLALLQLLRRYRYPVSGANLASQLNISIRTLYRDIASLQAQGAAIDGEPGVGYILRPGFMLPPLMFSQSELEALVLGARWVTKFTDASMTESAENALAKISDVLPQELRQELEHNTLLVGPRVFKSTETVDLGVIRQSIRQQQKLHIIYSDTKKRTTTRIIWPFALGYFEDTRIVAGWCETRHDFRHFRTDRIHQATMMIDCYPRHRSALLKEWRSLQYQDDV